MAKKDPLEEFESKLSSLKPSKEEIALQHQKGKLTAFERIALLLDKDTFVELDAFVHHQSAEESIAQKKELRDGVVCGYGLINRRQVYVFAQDFSFMGGSMGEAHNRKIAHMQKLALKMGSPIIGLFDSGGARIQEGVSALDGGGEIFRLNTASSGIIPQIAAILGPCAGIAAYSPALMDMIFMTKKNSHLFITGPEVIKAVSGEAISFDDLGGAKAHSEKSGVAHMVADDEKSCIKMIRAYLTYLPQNNLENPQVIDTADSIERPLKDLGKIIPLDQKKAYDSREVIVEVLDKGTFFEIQKEYAKNAIIGLGRLNSRVVGIIANQPSHLAGCLDINSSDKIARFVRLCDSFNIPLINFVDVTGYLPGIDQEHSGIIRHGAKILYAFSDASVPKIALVMRKAFGGAYIALVSKEMGFDMVLSYPTAQIAVMGSDQAVNILHRKELKDAEENAEKKKAERIEEYSEKFLNPYIAAGLGKIDRVIEMRQTRKALIESLEMLGSKRDAIVSKERKYRKHGNMPL